MKWMTAVVEWKYLGHVFPKYLASNMANFKRTNFLQLLLLYKFAFFLLVGLRLWRCTDDSITYSNRKLISHSPSSFINHSIGGENEKCLKTTGILLVKDLQSLFFYALCLDQSALNCIASYTADKQNKYYALTGLLQTLSYL